MLKPVVCQSLVADIVLSQANILLPDCPRLPRSAASRGPIQRGEPNFQARVYVHVQLAVLPSTSLARCAGMARTFAAKCRAEAMTVLQLPRSPKCIFA